MRNIEAGAIVCAILAASALSSSERFALVALAVIALLIGSWLERARDRESEWYRIDERSERQDFRAGLLRAVWALRDDR